MTCGFADLVMTSSGDSPKSLCRRCSWLEEATRGHIHPLPAVNGVPIDFSTYPTIGPVATYS